MRTGGRRSGRAVSALLVALLAPSLVFVGLPRPAEGRVDPLALITQQVDKPNVLVVLDISGSMTGLPGSPFSASTEAGVDCDNGTDCRGWSTPTTNCPGPPSCSPVLGTACPAGMIPGGPNLVFNGDFSIGAGSGPGIAAAAGFTTGVPNAGDGNYAPDTTIALQTGPQVYATAIVQQGTFPGDGCMGIPPTPTWLYANGNSTPGPYKIWEQTVSGLKPNTPYAVWAYISNAVYWAANYSPPSLPTWTFQRNGTDLGPALVQRNETDIDKTDRWNRVQFGFTTGGAETSGTFSLWDSANGGDGDDAAITQINLRECVPSPFAICSSTYENCGPTNPCRAVGRCSLTGEECQNPGGTCRTAGLCSGTSVKCYTDADCPENGQPGVCTVTGGACTGSVRCPWIRTCSATGQSCHPTWGCPRNATRGYCAEDHTKSCDEWSDCRAGCLFPDNLCSPPDNWCVLPRLSCVTQANNCVAQTNTCLNMTQTPAPTCQTGTSTGIKMCQLDGSLCTSDADCTAGGDRCGPPTSRAVIAKRVLKRVVEKSYDVANLGLMTYWHSGEFPYFLGARPVSGDTVVDLISREQLIAAGCYNSTTGPAATCALSGKPYVLAASNASQYLYPTGGVTIAYSNENWCGDTCRINAGANTGTFTGAYYQYAAIAFPAGSQGKVMSATYQGRNTILNGSPYVYYTPNPGFYNGGEKPIDAPGFTYNDCASSNACGTRCGGRWDTQLAPFLDVTGTAAQSNALSIAAQLEKAKNGGLVPYSSAPLGCTLQNSGVGATANPERFSAYHYMSKVLADMQTRFGVSAATAQTCKPNYVLLVTDGASDGPGDVGAPAVAGQPPPSTCGSAACAAANPIAAGCACAAVNAAYNLRTQLGVKTLVVGFGADATSGAGLAMVENIARAGGTDAANDARAPYAYSALREPDLEAAVRNALDDAGKGSFSTSVISATAGLQTNAGLDPSLVIDTRIDYPSWKGHVIAYDVSSGTPQVKWDAATALETMDWKRRRVYVGSSTGLTRIQVDPSTGAITNAATLATLGVGASAWEASDVAHWLLGDPVYGNRALLGSIVSSTPIEVGAPGDTTWAGGHLFYTNNKSRPALIYVGADDGILHAFFSKDTTLNGTTYAGGSEAFAFLPADLIPNVMQLYARRGEPSSPKQHVYGVASSPKAKNLCVANCTSTTADWRTLLMFGNGFGGNDLYMLDVTSPFDANGVKDPPIGVMWSSSWGANAGSYDAALGQTVSVPGFFFNKTTTLDDHRVILASGYPVDTTKVNQGKRIVVASGKDGSILANVAPTVPAAGCAQEYTMLTDVAIARDNYRDATTDNYLRLVAGYFGDTWGNLWRYGANGTISSIATLGCNYPLHFAPAVIQLDRDSVTTRRGEIYIVQVTNSSLDTVTAALPESKLIIYRDKSDTTGAVSSDASFGTGGKLEIRASQLCATMANGSCTSFIPANARPIGTPTAILGDTGSNFKLITLWFVPPGSACGDAQTYLSLLDVDLTALTITPKGAQTFAPGDTVLGSVVAGGKLYVATSNGLTNVGSTMGITLKAAPNPAQAGASGPFRRGAWVEVQ